MRRVVLVGDRFRDADNAQGLHRTLRVATLLAYAAICHEEGSARYPEIGLSALADETRFVRVESVG